MYRYLFFNFYDLFPFFVHSVKLKRHKIPALVLIIGRDNLRYVKEY